MLPPPSLLARGPVFGSLWAALSVSLTGVFWYNASRLPVNCRGEEATAVNCASGLIVTALLGVCSILSLEVAFTAAILPIPKIRRTDDESHHWLSPEFTHIGYTQPDERGYQQILYLNHPTTPSKIRFNMADPGTHASELVIRDLEDLSLWPKRQQGADENWFVDISRDDEMPPLFNDFTELDALPFVGTLSTNMINYLSNNNLNGTCFIAQYPSSTGGLRQAIFKIEPSTTGNGSENFPALECGTDIGVFNTNVPLY